MRGAAEGSGSGHGAITGWTSASLSSDGAAIHSRGAPKDPHVVLGVEPDATPDEIKAAWRALARQHHPDLTGDDPRSPSVATRRMAEINAAYAALTRAEGAAARTASPAPGREPGDGTTRTAAAPPDEARAGPVTGRVDTSGTVHPRNQTTTPPGIAPPAHRPAAAAPDRSVAATCAPPSRPARWSATGSTATSCREAPALDEALVIEVDVREVPRPHAGRDRRRSSRRYIDWLAGTLTREPARRAGRAGHRRGAGPAGDPPGAPAAAPGLALEPVPLAPGHG